MNPLSPPVRTRIPSEQGKTRLLTARWNPLFVADWHRVVFLHFEVDPEHLARHVPFELDLFEGRAFVSLVAFTMRSMRLHRGGRATAWLTAPIATHPFLNVRTYVRHRGEPGIHFLREWMDNIFARYLGPWVFGLPYRGGVLRYEHEPDHGRVHGRVEGGGQVLSYEGTAADAPEAVKAGGWEEFLLERYTAFNQHPLGRSLFRIWHMPWPVAALEVTKLEAGLLMETPGGNDWAPHARFVGAHCSPGLNNVWMGRPHIAG